MFLCSYWEDENSPCLKKDYFFGGEDYELVFSLPKQWAKNLSQLDKDITEIGFFTDGKPSIEFKDNKKNDLLRKKPFKHF